MWKSLTAPESVPEGAPGPLVCSRLELSDGPGVGALGGSGSVSYFHVSVPSLGYHIACSNSPVFTGGLN